MAFCQACGAQLTGTFCGRCGAAASAAGQAAAPQQPPQPQAPPQQPPQPQAQPYQAPPYHAPPYQAQPYQAPAYQGQPMGVAPAKKGTSPVVWILLIAGGVLLALVVCVVALFGLGVGSSVIGTAFLVHKAKQAGLDPELMRTNPGLAISKMVTAFNPDVEVLDHNDRDGTITVRDRKTGKVVKMTFDDVKSGQFKMKIQENGQTASLNFGTNAAAKLPSWVPAYPGATTKSGGFSMTSSGDNGDAGNFAFTTSDSAERVQSFYEGKAHEMNMEVEATVATGFGTVVKLTDQGTHHTIAVTIVGASPTTVNVTYASK
jgi:hypothetical protein